MTREPIYAAVFKFWSDLTVGGAPAFKTATRLLKHWDAVPGEDSPALLMLQKRENATYRKGLPTIWNLDIALYLYVRTNLQNDNTVIPSVILNPLLDAIEAALTIDDQANLSCTLGGLVSHCAISGPIEIYEGDLGDELVAIVPLNILTSP